MMNEHSGISRRKLLRTTAIGVPAAGMLAFGSTLVTATSANALTDDGYWGSETTVEHSCRKLCGGGRSSP